MLHEEALFSADPWHVIIMARRSNQVQLEPPQTSRQLQSVTKNAVAAREGTKKCPIDATISTGEAVAKIDFRKVERLVALVLSVN
jgi:hypothetical protein